MISFKFYFVFLFVAVMSVMVSVTMFVWSLLGSWLIKLTFYFFTSKTFLIRLRYRQMLWLWSLNGERLSLLWILLFLRLVAIIITIIVIAAVIIVIVIV